MDTSFRSTLSIDPDQLLRSSFPQLFPSPNTSPSPCPICTNLAPLISTPTCFHRFCQECLTTYLEIKISESQVLSIPCPGCTVDLSEHFIQSNINEQMKASYQKFVEIKKLEKNIFVKWCPQPDCQGYDTASYENYNLTCNTCGHKFCYICSKPWHKRRCKVKTDLGFELWAMANNVKICPRCKNHVQKNGGCPHMYCPRCQHRWCWICGGDYQSPDHNSFTCYIGKTPLDLYWGIIFFMLFFPFFIPFFIFLMVVYVYESESIEKERLNGIFSCFKHRFVAYLLAFLLSPVVEVVGIVVAYFAITFSLAMKNSYYERGCVDRIFRVVVGNMLCNVVFVCVTVVMILMVGLLPVCGVFFTVTKMFYSVVRCFKPRPAFEYPRLFG